MGFALIEELLNRGAKVTVLKAKTSISFDIVHSNLDIISTRSADDMNQAMLQQAKIMIFLLVVPQLLTIK